MVKITLMLWMVVFLTAGADGANSQGHGAPDVSPQEKQCMARGWQRVVLPVGGLARGALWKAPAGSWIRGAIIVMHGGGGSHVNFCVANSRITEPQVSFTTLAIAQGFAVFLLDSSDQVTDNAGRLCGKVWDDEVRDRANLDLPYVRDVIRALIPRLRPPGSRNEIFMTGLSSGGYMTVRAATHFDDLITAFAPISSGDPYGWYRICEKGMTRRTNVHGMGVDNETGKQIIERNSCFVATYKHEKRWDSANPPLKPAFRVFHHRYDGIVDLSCGEKVAKLLEEHGYRESAPFLLTGDGKRSFFNHLWQDEYNGPLLGFFTRQLR